jgi:hypothetical protein
MERLQTRRRDLTERVETLPSRETELLTVHDQIAFLELGANQTILATFTAYQMEERWLDQLVSSLEEAAARLDEESDGLEADEEQMTSFPEGPTREWIEGVGGRVTEALGSGQRALKREAAALRALVAVIAYPSWVDSPGGARDPRTSRGVGNAGLSHWRGLAAEDGEPGLVAPQTVMTTFPRACPSSR